MSSSISIALSDNVIYREFILDLYKVSDLGVASLFMRMNKNGRDHVVSSADYDCNSMTLTM